MPGIDQHYIVLQCDGSNSFDRCEVLGEECCYCGVDLEAYVDDPDGGDWTVVKDDDDDLMCSECWAAWAGEYPLSMDSCPAEGPAKGSMIWQRIQMPDGTSACDGCGEQHSRGDCVAYGEDGSEYCSDCWHDYHARGEAEPEQWACTTCEAALEGVPSVNDSDGSAYCMGCWSDWAQGARPTSAGAPLAIVDKTADMDNKAKNERNLARLRLWYPGHCAYELYFKHVRNRAGQACGREGCKLSHEVPDDLADKLSQLE